jgi:hypothetical protein
VVDERQLLRKIMRGKKIDARGTEVMGNDYGKQFVSGIYALNHQSTS